MPRREEDPSLVGLVISFDPVEEERRYEEEEEQRRLAKKLKKHQKKKAGSSICSGATASTSKSGSNVGSVPEKIVTTATIDVEESTTLEEKKDAKPTKKEKKNDKSSKKEKSSKHEKKESKKSKSERHGKTHSDVYKTKSKRDGKKSKSRKNPKKDSKSKKTEKIQKRAARNIQRIARGYLVRSKMEQIRQDAQALLTDNASKSKTPARRMGARFRQMKDTAASRLQRAFRIHRIRESFKRGDRRQWREAWQKLFIFSILSPTERIRQKRAIMQGPRVPRVEDSSESSDQDYEEDFVESVPMHIGSRLIQTSNDQNDLLLEAIPEDQSHCESVDCLLAPLEEGDDASVASYDDLMADMMSVPSVSTATTCYTAGSPSPRRTVRPKVN